MAGIIPLAPPPLPGDVGPLFIYSVTAVLQGVSLPARDDGCGEAAE